MSHHRANGAEYAVKDRHAKGSDSLRVSKATDCSTLCGYAVKVMPCWTKKKGHVLSSRLAHTGDWQVTF